MTLLDTLDTPSWTESKRTNSSPGKMISHLILLLLLCLTVASSWTTTRRSRLRANPLFVSSSTEEQETNEGNPCWQDIYDDDCSMSNIFAAHFVASEWIKTMPCAMGIDEDCMPNDLTVPETRPEAGVDHVDVMDFLGLSRAKTLEKTSQSSSGDLKP